MASLLLGRRRACPLVTVQEASDGPLCLKMSQGRSERAAGASASRRGESALRTGREAGPPHLFGRRCLLGVAGVGQDGEAACGSGPRDEVSDSLHRVHLVAAHRCEDAARGGGGVVLHE